MIQLEHFFSQSVLFDAINVLLTDPFSHVEKGTVLGGRFLPSPVETNTVETNSGELTVHAQLDWSAGPVIASDNTRCSQCIENKASCKHIAAIALDYLARQKPIKPYPSEKKRADTAERLMRTELNQRFDPYPNMARHRVVYLLSRKDNKLHIDVHKGYVSKTGQYCVKTDLGFDVITRSGLPKFITELDLWLLNRLRHGLEKTDPALLAQQQESISLSLDGLCDSEFITLLTLTQRCFWVSCTQQPLKLEQHFINDFIDTEHFLEVDRRTYLDLASMSMVDISGPASLQALGAQEAVLALLADDERDWQPQLTISRRTVDLGFDNSHPLDLDIVDFSLASEHDHVSFEQIFSSSSEQPQFLTLASELSTQLSAMPLLSAHFEATVWRQFPLGTRQLQTLSTETLVELRRLMIAGWSIVLQLKNRYSIVTPQAWYGKLGHQVADKNWFDLELGVEVDGKKINILPYLVKAIRKGLLQNISDSESVFMELDSGQKLLLPAARVKHILDILVELYETKPLSEDEVLALPMHQLTRLAELSALTLQKSNDWQWQGSDWLKSKAEQVYRYLERGDDIRVAPPKGLKAELRDYQQSGLNWLQFLKRHEFSGILADDMGLGKTIQTLSAILLDKEAGKLTKPCLVVAPTSLLANWYHEAQSFAPALNLLLWSGPKRHKFIDDVSQSDLIITSYGTLQQDVECWSEQHFHLVILDEAQTIKNVRSRISRVVATLSASNKLCLTGTPLENHLGELWSLFNFLMPGFLGSYSQFQRHYQLPIERDQDDEKRLALVKRISPFMLRRVKSDVASELPEKTIINEYISLNETQGDLYETIRLTMSEEVRKAVSVSGVKRNRLAISNALLKLRQVCCHPDLLKLNLTSEEALESSPENAPLTAEALPLRVGAAEPYGAAEQLQDISRFHGASGKLNWLADKLPGMVEKGRRVLIFSSFTSMLSLIAELLQQLSIEHIQLTGKSRHRGDLVDRFQQGDIPIFLISLKAGGAGLNLTAADVVIHTDPWWNPAAEQQASDRAHRIGQDKSVFVYKLICKDTVEERIQLLQESKQDLANSIYQEKTAKVSEMSGNDWLELLQPMDVDE